VRVARTGEADEPMHPAPAPLRRYLNFAKLPTPALDIARRVLDDDPEFRERVIEATTEEDLGEAAWLWLTRPHGWEQRVDAIRRDAQNHEAQARDERSEREAQRRLIGAEAAARRAEALASARAQDADEARVALVEEHARRAALERRIDALEAQVARLADERAGAVRKLKDTEGELAQRSGDLRHARHQIRMLQTELQQALDGVPPAPAGPQPTKSAGGEGSAAVPGASAAMSPASPGQSTTDAFDRVALGRAVAEATGAVQRVSASLQAAARLLGQAVPPPAGPLGPRTRPDIDPGRGERGAGVGPVVARRRPAPLPPGVLDDDPAAADHLVRLPGTVLLVDGYNISHAAWPGHPVKEHRSRLVDALAELHARTGADVVVVFDGADPEPSRGASAPPGVRVRFSPPGVEADDVVLELVEAVPSTRPVVVASSDRRVRDGARVLGANVVGARQLLTTLRR
jgi:predicted RNA-binding protein with PIN domain